jgi:hypothetical protein
MERISPTPLIENSHDKPPLDKESVASRRRLIRRIMLGTPLVLTFSTRSAFAQASGYGSPTQLNNLAAAKTKPKTQKHK